MDGFMSRAYPQPAVVWPPAGGSGVSLLSRRKADPRPPTNPPREAPRWLRSRNPHVRASRAEPRYRVVATDGDGRSC